jgi:hypothetical protein
VLLDHEYVVAGERLTVGFFVTSGRHSAPNGIADATGGKLAAGTPCLACGRIIRLGTPCQVVSRGTLCQPDCAE